MASFEITALVGPEGVLSKHGVFAGFEFARVDRGADRFDSQSERAGGDHPFEGGEEFAPLMPPDVEVELLRQFLLADKKLQAQGGEVIAMSKVTVNQVVPRAGIVKGT